MVSSFTPNKGFDKPANGDYVDDWNIPVNGDWDIADRGFGGTLSVALTNSNINLSQANCQNVRIVFTGAITANITIFFPANVAGYYIVTNGTSGGYTLTLASAGGSPGTSLVLGQGYTSFIFSDGANVFYADDPRITINAGTGIAVTGTVSPTISLQVPVDVANGGTGATSLTANSVLIGNGTSTVAGVAPGPSGNVLTSNGTTWTSAPASGPGGGITSINFATTVGMGLSYTNGSVTTSGQTVTLTGTLSMANGGTGTTSVASGLVRSNGTVLSGGAQVSLTSDVTGILPTANGGTGTLGTGVSAALGQPVTGSGGFVLASSPSISSPSVSGGTFSSPSLNTASLNTPTVTTGAINFGSSSSYVTLNSGVFGVYASGNICSGTTAGFTLFGTLTVNGVPYANQTTFTLISDERTKTDIAPYSKSVEAIRSLKPITFKYNGKFGSRDDGQTRVGLLAQDVQNSAMKELVSERVYEDPDTGEKTTLFVVNPSDLIFTMINAIKELEERIAVLEAKTSA